MTTYAIAPEKAMAPHSSTLAWKIPWTEEPGGLQSMGSLRVGHDRATSLSLFTFMSGRKEKSPGANNSLKKRMSCKPPRRTAVLREDTLDLSETRAILSWESRIDFCNMWAG